LPSFQRLDDPSPFICRRSDSVLAAIERCLDNGVGLCFVVQGRRIIGRLDLDDLRQALREGALARHGNLGQLLTRGGADSCAHSDPSEPVRPVLDEAGQLLGIEVNRSRRPVSIAGPDLSHAELRAFLDAFLSSWISSSGAYVQRFQEQFAAFIGRRRGIATSNGTAALHLALTALGIGPGDEVIVPDLTFAATINAVIHSGATPVIVDVDPDTWGLSRDTVLPALTARTKAILPVHLYGRPVDMTPLLELAESRGLHVIEDCAEAIGARHRGRLVGGFGSIACFSFFANKTITTGEGGMCLTDSPSLADRLAELRDHGMARHRRYWHERVGFNYRMTNPQAAIGVAQLGRIETIIERNRRLEGLYREHLTQLPGVVFPGALPAGDEAAIWLVSLLVPPGSRAALIEAAARAQVELRPFFYCLSEMPIYRPYGRDCPVSRSLSRAGLNLPTSAAVDATVVRKLRDVFRDAPCPSVSPAAGLMAKDFALG
jgi:perosamine synthetase